MEQKELRGLEDRCIQEYAPPCTAACPIHVDVRGMMSEISRGDLEAALKIIRKTLPFSRHHRQDLRSALPGRLQSEKFRRFIGRCGTGAGMR